MEMGCKCKSRWSLLWWRGMSSGMECVMEMWEENGGERTFCSWTRRSLVPVLIAGVILIEPKSGDERRI